MRLAIFAAAAAALAIAPGIASAQTVEQVGKFTGVELHGGGTITIRQGPAQRVTLVRGDPAEARFEVDSRGHLIASPCRGSCWGIRHFDVEIETPDLNEVAIYGGGHISAKGAFPATGAMSAEIHGGGDIDVRDVPAQATSAAIHGGGKIFVSAQNRLEAAIHGGGAIHYVGHPTVNSEIHGGGSISPIQ
ncbi:GIN domain-containing protein [Phenylobacterium sp.]|uniref:GIN domain-containing protein n=1 Tax=Phenylobacterium sp. TaxID=1871053 RepID=UPI002BDFA40E|nr:DUF2807 domain-containing protein [Phenylobacterium sp.]HLZ76696.1 DUF2807 domain-containing protein [Phenylobacterium sp.]